MAKYADVGTWRTDHWSAQGVPGGVRLYGASIEALAKGREAFRSDVLWETVAGTASVLLGQLPPPGSDPPRSVLDDELDSWSPEDEDGLERWYVATGSALDDEYELVAGDMTVTPENDLEFVDLEREKVKAFFPAGSWRYVRVVHPGE